MRLDRRRILAYAAMLLMVEVALASFIIAGTHGLLGFSGDNITTDFVSFYAASTLADTGTPELAYDPAAHFLAEQQARSAGIEYNYFYYPPVYLLLFAALARLPYLVAFLVFEAATLALYLVVMTTILGEASWSALAAIVAFPVVFWNFGWGQNGFLSAALMGAGTLFLDERPILSGLLLGALCYKPHFGVLIPIALASGRHWRSFVAAGISAMGLIALSLVVFGTATWRNFIAAALASPATYAAGKIKFYSFATPFGATMLLGGGANAAYAIQAVATIAAAGLVAIVWYRNLSLPVRAALLAAAAVVAVPIALFYDLLLTSVAVAWLCRTETGLSGMERLFVAACYLLLLGPDQVSEYLRLPFAPAAALAILAIAVRHAGHEMRAGVSKPA
jgi:alpha-1,2-mannosyltransferase